MNRQQYSIVSKDDYQIPQEQTKSSIFSRKSGNFKLLMIIFIICAIFFGNLIIQKGASSKQNKNEVQRQNFNQPEENSNAKEENKQGSQQYEKAGDINSKNIEDKQSNEDQDDNDISEDEENGTTQDKEKLDTKQDEEIQKNDDNENEDNSDNKGKEDQTQKQKEYICEEGQVYSSDKCQKTCAEDFEVDNEDRLCKPRSLMKEQIKLMKLKNGSSSQFYQVLQSITYTKKKEGKNGFFFFNRGANLGINYLNQIFGYKVLPSVLENIDGIIVALPGSEEYYVTNEEEVKQIIQQVINQNKNIQKWYTCGVFNSGGFNALRYFTLSSKLFEGTLVINPDYMKNVSEIQAWMKLKNVSHTDLEVQFHLIKQKMKKKPVYIIEENKSLQHLTSRNLASIIDLNIFYFDNQEYPTETSQVQSLFFGALEQMVSISQKQDCYNF